MAGVDGEVEMRIGALASITTALGAQELTTASLGGFVVFEGQFAVDEYIAVAPSALNPPPLPTGQVMSDLHWKDLQGLEVIDDHVRSLAHFEGAAISQARNVGG